MDGGAHFLREAYERGLLVDPESLADDELPEAVPALLHGFIPFWKIEFRHGNPHAFSKCRCR